MSNQELIELVSHIEKESGKIYVREKIGGSFDNVLLTELPAPLAIKHICRILRTRLRYEGQGQCAT